MHKMKLALCVTLALLLSGCGETNKKVVTNTDNKQKTVLNNQKNMDTSIDKDLKEASKVTITPKPFTPVVLPDISSLSTKPIEWSWLYSARDSATLLSKYKGYGFGDTSKKIIYLTFDEGYENGYTTSILNTLKANNVHAAFFVTKPFVTGSYNGVPDASLIKRMSSEGHIIANHSVHHKSMPKFTAETDFNAEITGVENSVNNIEGCKMSHYFRPPEGTFSELSLYYTQKIGYKSVFFTCAYQDYNAEKQPQPEAAKATILRNTRNGMICLLHAMSKTNDSILDSLIKEWKARGYEFKTLNDLPS